MKSIENIIKETVLRETNSSIIIDDSHFFAVIVDDKNKKKLWSFIVLLSVIIICITIIAHSLFFFINDVLLFQNSVQMNKQGAIISNRSCNRQSIIYLLNSAENWANTGIQLQKGDEIKISVSGGFHSDVAMIKNAAVINEKPRYEWISFQKDKKYNNKNLLYNDTTDKNNTAYFGSMLFQIAHENGPENNDKDNSTIVNSGIIQQISGQSHKEKVKRNGILYFSVNDIYLTDCAINQLEQANTESLKQPEIDSLVKTIPNDSTTLGKLRGQLLLYYVEDTTVYYCGEKFRNHFKENRKAYFYDNIGEVLIVIDINRKLSTLSWPSLYRNTEEKINEATLDNNILYTILLIAISLIAISSIAISLCKRYSKEIVKYLKKIKIKKK